MNKKITLIALFALVFVGIIGIAAYFLKASWKQPESVSIVPKISTRKVEKIPSYVALDDRLLVEFLIEEKILKPGERYSPAGLEFNKVIREDLNKDGENEIIIGLGFQGPTMGWIGLIRKEKGEYLLFQWEDMKLCVLDMELKEDMPGKGYRSLIVKKGGSGGTGLFQKKMVVYLIDEKDQPFLRLIWHGFLRNFGLGSLFGRDAEYNIEFEDVNDDGVVEIIQTGVIRKIKSSESAEVSYIILKETPIGNVFKYSHEDEKYVLWSPDDPE